ncbi:MAG TPA: hypothetical protein VGJ21_00755, partial [Terracidiphilus sp.]
MNNLVMRFSRQIAAVLVLLVAAQMSEAAALPTQEAQQQAAQTQPASSSSTDGQPAGLPDSPAPAQQNIAQADPQFAARPQQATQQDAQQQDAQKPVGTAAGPETRPVGVAGSRPSGAAIAPAKQRRVKAIVIRVGLIVAGAAAAGAVIG